MNHYDIVVIGAGKTGRLIAQELHQKKKKVALVTLNDDSATLLDRTIKAISIGSAGQVPDPHGPEHVDTFRGSPCFQSDNKVLTVGPDSIGADQFVIATGAIPFLPSIQGLEETPRHTPLSILSEAKSPSSMVILGAGPMAVCLAGHFSSLNTHVTLLTNKDQILPKEEEEIAATIRNFLEERGVQIQTQTSLIQTWTKLGKVVCVVEGGEKRNEIQAEVLVVAAGFIPNTKGFGLDTQRVYVDERGRVVVNDLLKTSAPHIWAAGGVTGPPFSLALHEHQATLLVNNMTTPFFGQTRLDNEPFPMTFPFHPPVAQLGMAEAQAKEKYKDTVVSVYKEKGLIKLIGRSKSGEILGVHILGAHAEEMILTFNLAKLAGIGFYELLDRQHYPSPTAGEAIYFAIKKWATNQ